MSLKHMDITYLKKDMKFKPYRDVEYGINKFVGGTYLITNKMSNFNDKIYDSYINSCNLYLKNFQSNHWSYQIKKEKELYKIENLKNFRNNFISGTG